MYKRLLISLFIMTLVTHRSFGTGLGNEKRQTTQLHTEMPNQKPDKVSLAVKSNLLFDLAATPNIEAEIAIGKRWSVNADFIFPWWLNKSHNSFAYQLLSGSIEGRVWLGSRENRRVLTGHFLGVYAGTGTYDIQFHRNDGYQGEMGITGGISYGYVIPVINDHFSLELSIGIGYMQTRYKKYDVVDNASALAYNYSGNYTWIGPMKAKVSFVWILPLSNRKGR